MVLKLNVCDKEFFHFLRNALNNILITFLSDLKSLSKSQTLLLRSQQDRNLFKIKYLTKTPVALQFDNLNFSLYKSCGITFNA
jgi:hypothetical protein